MCAEPPDEPAALRDAALGMAHSDGIEQVGRIKRRAVLL
jgi:hypothetical protein